MISQALSRTLARSLFFSPSLNDLPEKCTKSEWFCRFFSPCLSKFTQTWCAFQARISQSFCTRTRSRAPGEKPRALAAALRASNLQVCPHTTLLPYKKPVSTCVNTGLTCMLSGASSPHSRSRSRLHACRASYQRALAARSRSRPRLHACRACARRPRAANP